MESMIAIEQISKRYGKRTVLRDISLSAQKGEIIALIGRNGAGKSTLMNIITGYISPTSGSAYINGYDVQLEPMQARKLIGYLPEQPPIYPDMTVHEYLMHAARMKGLEKGKLRGEVSGVIERTGLGVYTNRLGGRLSKGYRQRLGLAQALLGKPGVLVLDEPGNGLDPMQAAQLREIIRSAGQHSVVLLSSHVLSEVTSVCTRAAIIEQGALRYDGAMAELTASSASLRVVAKGNCVADALSRIPSCTRVEMLESSEGCNTYLLYHAPDSDPREETVQAVQAAGASLLELTPQQVTLERAFLDIIGSEVESV